MVIAPTASRRSRTKVHMSMLRVMTKLEKKLERILIGSLNGIYNEVAGKVLSGNNKGVTASVATRNKQIKRALRAQYLRTGSIFANQVFDQLGEEEKEAYSEREIKNFKTDFFSFLNVWATKEAATKVVMIGARTKHLLASIISRGIENGQSQSKISKTIRERAGITNPSRARTIAGTETHLAMVFSTDEAVKATGREVIRVWTPVLGPRTRPAHLKANNQRRKKDKPFSVKGEALMYPGDPSGSPENTINCRCVLLYEPVRPKRRRNR